jgi:hypothetical protein
LTLEAGVELQLRAVCAFEDPRTTNPRFGRSALAFKRLTSEQRLLPEVSRTGEPWPDRSGPDRVAAVLGDGSCVYRGRRCSLWLLVFSRQLAPSFSRHSSDRAFPVATARPPTPAVGIAEGLRLGAGHRSRVVAALVRNRSPSQM